MRVASTRQAFRSGSRSSSPAGTARGASERAVPVVDELAAATLAFLAVVFNALLAIVNAHVLPLTPSIVIASEVAIVGAAHLVILRNFQPRMLPWYGLVMAIVLFAFFRTAVVGHLEPKFARDILLIPTFVMLGMTVSLERTKQLVIALHAVVVGGVLFEAVFTDAYADLFRVRDYYIATRSFDDSSFWDKSSDLFVSATRPDERFFNFVDLHRLSSIFLEPVTLGNYVIIINIFLAVFYRHLGWKLWTLIFVGNLVALVACDGRLAALSSVIIVLVCVIAPLLPRGSALLYLPAALAGAVLLSVLTGADPRADDFTGRIAYCVQLLSRYELMDWLGLSDQFVGPAADSGIAYMVTTQSLIGVVLLFTLLVLSADQSRPEQIRYLHAASVLAVLTLLISYSLFSIKTAAPLWFIHGALQAAGLLRAKPVVWSRVESVRGRLAPVQRPSWRWRRHQGAAMR
ncbi:MAG: polysaccharide biosynthesis protein GumE [Hyphomicrobiaceae bacterium]